MKPLVVCSGLLAASVAAFLWLRGNSPGDQQQSDLALIDRYCTDCHNPGEQAGGLSLVGRDVAGMHADAEVWEAVVEKLEAGMMPPPGEPRPALAELTRFVSGLTQRLDAAAELDPNPGAPVLHRLNRTEYANAVRDLLGLPIDVTTLLPADDSSEGFDNIANALSISPAHMQAYLSAAAKISRLAVGDSTVSPANTTYNASGGLDHAYHIEGLALGTRGGLQATHIFPLDAEYEFSARRFGGGIFLDTVGGDEDLEVTLDGERILVAPAGAPGNFRTFVPAGAHELTATLVASSKPQGVDDLYANLARSTGVTSLSIMGPFNASGPGETESRARIFTCRPVTRVGTRGGRADQTEADCARDIFRRLATQAFRRPISEDDAALELLMEQFATGRALRGFETGVQYGIARILVDPEFIFRFEAEPADLVDGASYDVGPLELASRLAFFLWSSIPDSELLALAQSGELLDSAVLAAQVHRMLRDSKSDSLVHSFAAQWLMLRQLDTVNPASGEFDANLRQSFRRETELLFNSILREDRSIVDLLSADYTFLDERLGRHYGLTHIRGSHFRRVDISNTPRRGILGHGSVLTVTSAPNRTSPVIRGAWILENILGTPAPLPPPGVETNLDEEASAEALPVSLRARLEQHRADPSCAACHSLIDPLGFALENYDEVGQWRDFDGREVVDASGELWDGTQLNGPASLNSALLQRREAFVRVAVKKLLTYALGRAVEPHDMPAVRRIANAAAEDDYRFSALVLGIVDSVPFRMKRKEREDINSTLAAEAGG